MVLTLEVGQMVKKGAMRKFKEFFPTMFKMIGGCSPEMMPEHLGMILAKLPEEKRIELVKKMVSVLMEQQKQDTQGQKFNEFYQRQ